MASLGAVIVLLVCLAFVGTIGAIIVKCKKGK